MTQLLPYHLLLLLRVSNRAILRCHYHLLVSEKFIIFIYETILWKKIIYKLYIKYKIYACYVKYKKNSYQLHKKFLIKFISRNQSCFHVVCIFVNRFCYLFRGDIIQGTHSYTLMFYIDNERNETFNSY